MLVLTRKLQQKIKIGDAITVTILRVKGQTVRVGIEAPREVRVVRGELPSGGQSEDSPAAQTTIIETRLTITDEVESGSAEESRGDAGHLDGGDGPAGRTHLPLAPRIPLPLHLPQRKRFSRDGAPPLRVTHHSSPTLAK